MVPTLPTSLWLLKTQGVVYAYVNACSELPISDSNHDHDHPCSTTAGTQCTFKCDDGFVATDSVAMELAKRTAPFQIDIPLAFAAIDCVGDLQMRAAWVTIPAHEHCRQVHCPANSSPRPVVTLGGEVTGNDCICDKGYVGTSPRRLLIEIIL